MRKTVKAKPRSPSVSNTEGRLSSAGARYSTGSKGRACPANLEKKVKAKGNPAGAKKR